MIAGFGTRGIGLALTGALLVFSGATAHGQEGSPPPPPPGESGGQIMIRTGGRGIGMGFMGFEAGIAGKTVRNAPFSATVSTEVTRTLADGNKIDEKITGSIARDSEGRTRRDMTLPGAAMMTSAMGGEIPHAVFIGDPVAGTSYILHPDAKVADQVPFRPMKKALRAFRNDSGMRTKRQATDEWTTTDLGTQTINGVAAQGTRITRTIPAGKIGNERPIVIVTERWYSLDLQTYVLTKSNDPLTGDTVFQLTDIQRQEPDAALFQVPSDYVVRQGAVSRMRYRRNGGPEAPAPEE